MEKRQLGRSTLRVAPLCLGGNVFGWTADEATSFRLLDRALAAGLDFIDTAEMYSVWVPGHRGGESEAIIGAWLASRGCRGRVTLATKVGADMGDTRKGLAPARIRDGVEGSLRRLRTDRIDLYQAHYDDPATPLEDVLGTFGELIAEGKVLAIGASNHTPARLRAALASECYARPAALREPAAALQPLRPGGVRERTRAALRRARPGRDQLLRARQGLPHRQVPLEPAHLGQSQRGGGVAGYLNERGMRILAALDEVAAERGASPAQVALAWLMARPSITAPIASATSLAQLEDLIAAAELDLDRASIERLTRASA